jgi:hypothetical protein
MVEIGDAAWNAAISSLSELSVDQRKHFATLLIHLAKCYQDDSNHKALIFVDTGPISMLTFAINANEAEAANIINDAYTVMHAMITADAPDRDMYN